jgi:hypothetical protein
MQSLRPASGNPERNNSQRALIRWFKDIRLADAPLVGDKTASVSSTPCPGAASSCPTALL